MVKSQLIARGITNPEVLGAMSRIPRERFVPSQKQHLAYGDHPIPIGFSQTISQPYMVAYMTEVLVSCKPNKVLEIGTGSGYQTAVLAEVVPSVFTIEVIQQLAYKAKSTLVELGYDNIHFRFADGYSGWPGCAPFDAIMLTAAPPMIPKPLLEQLAMDGILIAPVGIGEQNLVVVTKTRTGFRHQKVMGVRFVPMTGEAQSGFD